MFQHTPSRAAHSESLDAYSVLHLCQITADSGRLIVDTALEASRAPVDKLDGTFGLDSGDRGVDVLRDDVTTVHHAASHVLAMTGIILGHQFEAGLKAELVISATESCS